MISRKRKRTRRTDETFREEPDIDAKEDEEVEDVLAVLLQERVDPVPLSCEPVFLVLQAVFQGKVLHPRNVGGRVQEIVLGTLAVEADRQKVAVEFPHHFLEVFVRQILGGKRKHGMRRVGS